MVDEVRQKVEELASDGSQVPEEHRSAGLDQPAEVAGDQTSGSEADRTAQGREPAEHLIGGAEDDVTTPPAVVLPPD